MLYIRSNILTFCYAMLFFGFYIFFLLFYIMLNFIYLLVFFIFGVIKFNGVRKVSHYVLEVDGFFFYYYYFTFPLRYKLFSHFCCHPYVNKFTVAQHLLTFVFYLIKMLFFFCLLRTEFFKTVLHNE